MQWLAAICVRRPVFTWVLMLALIVVGSASLLGLGVDRFPNIDFPVVIVTTVLPGASPRQMETEVSDKLEEAINTISGLDELRSNNFESLSVVVARFDLDKNTAIAAQEVRDRVNRTLTLLPSSIEQPRVERVDPDATPVMLVAVEGPRGARDLTEFANRRVRRQIETLSGVGGVNVLGGRARQVNVDVDPARLQAQGLTILDVQRALASQNIEVPGGNVYQGARTLGIRVQGRIENVEAINDVVLANRGGAIVRLRDVGTVIDGDADPSSLATLNGRDIVVLSIRKQSGTNTVAVIDALRERIAELQRTLPPGYRMQVVRDESEFIRNSIHAVEEHLIFGSLLAAFVVLLFLWNGRSTLIAALAIPTSIISTFALIKWMGLTLNTITLLGLTLAVGIVIDDAIVVLENIVRFIEEKGLPPRKAAILATKEIGLAVLATTLSLTAVFLPVAFMGGIVGRFMASFGFTMSFSIMVSLFVSFTLTPMLSARWLEPSSRTLNVDLSHFEKEEELDSEWVDPALNPTAQELENYRRWRAELSGFGALWNKLVEFVFSENWAAGRLAEKQGYREWRTHTRVVPAEFAHSAHGSGGIYIRFERMYGTLLAFMMERRWIVGLAIIIAFGAMGPLGKAVAKNFLPLDDESRFEIAVRAPEGTSLRQTQLISDRIARATRELGGVAYTVTTVGSPPGDPSGRGSNQASIFVALTPAHTRPLSQYDLIGRVRNEILPRFQRDRLRVIVSPVNVFGGGGAADSAAIQYVLRGPELEMLDRYSTALVQRMRTFRGLVDVDSTFVSGKPEYTVRIDRARAADLNVSVSDIAMVLRMLTGDVQVSSYAEGGEQYEIHLRANQTARERIDLLQLATVPAGMTGRTVRVADVVNVEENSGPSVIQRLARQRQVTVYANTVPGTSEATIIQQIEAARAELNMAPGYSGELAGRSKELGKASRSFLVAFVLSMVFMYLVLAAQFESWIHPITILVSLPLTMPFAILSLILLRQSLNIFSSLGVLVLFGIVKKNSILQVDHMRALRRRGLSRADAVMIGNRDRLRPILMTTIAFVAGMMPLLVSSGAGSGTNRAMSSVIIGGQTLSLLLTLLATPAFFGWFDDLSQSNIPKWFGYLFAPLRLIDRLFSSSPTPPPPNSSEHHE